ncbi:uncharacterized protein BKCO1_5900013 [Diplodia corticola]|uniref:Uncharacterized protein n=1 Tax=Diplodia corticola TaxID=236234 RepID=A0A1J9RQ32_9PEZI|nr:uncharacterized protein BKCO1_5900013 [Diplodia corticola]OJD30567.1 hypothetical protein BKCO1_5900013 [Diplodia corticola]
MPPVRPHLSVTLPKNFTFHYTDGEQPRTPEPECAEEPTEPPQLPRQNFRVRRRRRALPTYAPTNFSNASRDLPIPTIEAPEPGFDAPYPSFSDTPSEPDRGYLAPTPNSYRLFSPPKTPVAQIGMERISTGQFRDADIESQAESISRPSSACSGISDSSVSSRGSMDSYGGSCTSPESDNSDPFVFPEPKPSQYPLSSPLQAYNTERPAKRMRTRKDTVWTKAMDDHLWLTYMMCLQDPTVTPFKMLPGTVPPLGICTKVARQAKKTWRGGLAAKNQPTPFARNGRSGSNTPTTHDIPKPGIKWPRSEAAARGRLRKLSKRQPMLAAHYQRLLKTRTPSPFPSSSPRSQPSSGTAPMTSHFEPAQPADRNNASDSFSTRDMNVSLTASTSSMMQMGNPLHALAADELQQNPDDEWLGQQNARSNAHQKSQSLQYGLGLGTPVSGHSSSSSLASPFAAIPQKQHYDTQTIRPVSQPQPRLDSPVELHAPIPITRSFKRRAQQYLEDLQNAENSHVGQNILQELFGAPAEISNRRVRARGFSLGDMNRGARHLSALFTPPSSFDQSSGSPMAVEQEDQPELAPQPSADPARRLGSPFCGRPSTSSVSNTFPRMTSPRLFEESASFEERIGGLGG